MCFEATHALVIHDNNSLAHESLLVTCTMTNQDSLVVACHVYIDPSVELNATSCGQTNLLI
jgi:hypothetical protein